MTTDFYPGMGRAVAERTILRKKPSGDWETWGEVAHRVALGNALLCPSTTEANAEQKVLEYHLGKANILLSGRHLQHGDETQPQRNQEVFTNCLAGSTQILTMEYGSIELEKIAGQTVTVLAGDGQPRPAKIHTHGEQEVYDIEFTSVNTASHRHRRTVVATANHRWKLRDGSITESLEEGDIIAALPNGVKLDDHAVVHGLIFGDGTAHKSRHDSHRHISQGRTYASIRVCDKDEMRAKIHDRLDAAGYHFTTPPSAHGDRVYYLGKQEYFKEVPYTRDPEYIAGFFYGWWLADGHKAVGHCLEISTADEAAVQWALDHCAYAGFVCTTHRIMERQPNDGSFANGKALHVLRFRHDIEWKVTSIRKVGVQKVYCPEEPVTSLFVLGNGLLTGNCATSCNSFMLFYLLMNGSGVGRCYDDDLMLVDWDHAPNLRCVLSHEHPEFDYSAHESVRDAEHKYGTNNPRVRWHKVGDSREGWTKAVEIYEAMAYEKIHKDSTLVLDFSGVRPKGEPIKGMQNRPASGPVSLMNALLKAATVKGSGMARWKQAMYIDHCLAECVLVGGARRSARMSVKSWRDRSVLDFIMVKRPIEFLSKSMAEIAAYKRDVGKPQAFLWSSNNSIGVDQEFWSYVQTPLEELAHDPLGQHAHAVFNASCEAGYADGTGEPGLVNIDQLHQSAENLNRVKKFIHSQRYQVDRDSHLYLNRLLYAARHKKHWMVVNPCGEICLAVWGAFCVIADVVPYHADSLEEAEEAFRATTRALLRVNTMDSVYGEEVRRTNRIGVGITGIHEFAWKFFKLGFRDLLDEVKAAPFWQALSRFKRTVQEEAEVYARWLGVAIPLTDTTIKPAGTTSKLFGLTEGWHLPPMEAYLRWVQFLTTDPLVDQYRAAGYPVLELKTYKNTVIVGFPTTPLLSTLGLGDKLVTAPEATPDEQFRWLQLGEKYWLRGVTEDGTPLPRDSGNQISYTLKYDPAVVDFASFKQTVLTYQPTVKCCSVMPTDDTSSYEYLPEQPITKAEYEALAAAIAAKRVGFVLPEDVDKVHVDCAGGACPVDFTKSMTP